MKKKYGILAGVALMALASCTSDVIEEKGYKLPNEYIEFSTFSENGTRASKKVGYTFNVGEKISVYGFESNDTLANNQIFNNQEVENTAGNNNQVWTYSPKKYWTSGNKYEFYAAYPYEQPYAFDVTNKFFSLKDFVVNNDTAKQVDLMIAERNYASPNNVVELNFHHILSNVNFYAKVSADVNPKEVTSVDIISLDVTGLLNKGTYTQTGWTSNHQAVGAWETPAPQTKSDYYAFPAISGGQATPLAVGGNTYKDIATDMLLMPQKLFYVDDPEKGISAEMDPVLDVEFKVSYSDATSQTFKRSLRLSSLLSYTKRTLNASTGEYTDETVNEPIYQWLPNYKYNYFLCFNPAKTTRIWDADSDGSKGDDDNDQPNEKEGGSKYNPDDPNVIQVHEDTDGDGDVDDDDEWVEYPVVWEDIDGDGKLEGGIDKDGDGHIDNADGDKDTEFKGDDKYDPTDGDDENNPDGKDVIMVHVDTDSDGDVDDDDEWVQLQKDPETGVIEPAKETQENFIEFTAVVSDWEVEYGVNWEITK